MTKRVERNVHKMVWETVKALAADEYETVMANNELYRDWKEQWTGEAGKALLGEDFTADKLQDLWVQKRAPRLLEVARKSLAMCLNSPNMSEGQKNLIAEALIADASLRKGRIPRGQQRKPMWRQ
jgi:hypothetical protein